MELCVVFQKRWRQVGACCTVSSGLKWGNSGFSASLQGGVRTRPKCIFDFAWTD